ncbi:MAG: MFS transporter [Bacteroidaceae bacterium]|nr:MFS transporter [Bacteroidaceae bacterium]MDO4994469.1 MFS transporter [Bacteroidales bacterium]
MSSLQTNKMTNYRWVICAMLFFATTINYLDRQVLSLTYPGTGGIQEEFGWSDENYGNITAVFSIFYAICMLFAGKFIDWMGTKKGYLWSIFIWSTGAVLHAFCGILTAGLEIGTWTGSFAGALDAIRDFKASGGMDAALIISTTSVWLFLGARCILALGEAGNFPAAIKVTAEYFPKKDRAFATAIFNSGASVGALIAPFTIPVLAKLWGWEMAFIVIGALGYVWMAFWIFLYNKPEESKRVNGVELTYIKQDADTDGDPKDANDDGPQISFLRCFTFRQTWSFIVGKFMTDGVWWFFLFWTPAYLKSQFDINPTDTEGMVLIFILYLITMLSILGGKLPTVFINHGMNPYAGRMKAMLIFAFFPLLVLVAQPLGSISPWFPIIIIGIAGAAHQSWSANIFSTIGDMFPKSAIATITGIGGMAGGIGSYILQKRAGALFTYAEQMGSDFTFAGFEGKPAGYFIIFCICAVAYLVGWMIMKMLVPKYKPVIVE